MYRVELKELVNCNIVLHSVFVPNVPCGVESTIKSLMMSFCPVVPNVPCGVESRQMFQTASSPILFLMYRVELKDGRDCPHP